MVKKVKKYLKFVVCCALILSLIAPSYAALSASDGSAFVTKAEFDSALADFNARLTTFEAGINSKIDSQVTSYLDRNGIWNGASQFESNVTEKIFDWGKQSSVAGWPLFLISDPEQYYMTAGAVNTLAEGKQLLINNVSKSGLLYMHSKWGHHTYVKGGTANDFICYMACDRIYAVGNPWVLNIPIDQFLIEWRNPHQIGPYGLSDWRMNMTCFSIEMQVLLNGVPVISKQLCSDFKIETDRKEGSSTVPLCVSISIENGSGSDFVFVQKEDKVEVNWKVSVTPNTGGNADALSYCFYNTKAYNANMNTMSWKFDALSVY